ncbi:MAG: hypothetical protein O3C40_00835 [Planctomycetota bacterium]|nr:hypothetical protein [Planctomycetota bacterium]
MVVLIVAATTGSAGGQQAVTPRERLEAHVQARVLAAELVTSIFDVQLHHLEENGLTELPIYLEIRVSRDKIDQLVSTDMTQLTQLLQALQSEDVVQRDKLLPEARTTARRIAVAMMSERQRLRGRLRTSRTMILVRQMIALERQAIVATTGLKSQPDSKRQRLAAQLVQTHLDLAALFEQLIEVLRQATATVGPDRIGAAAALDHLAAEQTKARLSEAIEALNLAREDEAREAEQRVLDALEEVQRLLQQGAKLEEEARRQALEAIARTIEEQQQLRRRTESTELSAAKDRVDLAGDQRRIAEQLEALREPLSQLAQVGEQMLAAVDAAEEAAKHLSEGEKEQAVERQETVLNMLDDIARHLSAEALDPDALADLAAQLEELRTSLNELVEKQADASDIAASDPASAAELEAAIADALEEADDASQLSGDVESRLDEAQEAVKQAQQALEDGSPSAEQSRLEAVENAEKSLLEAAAEVQSQLADVQQAMEAANPSEANPSADSTSKNEASSGTTRDAGSTNASEQAADVESRSFENEAWFTRLPADLQNRIRGATRRPPPRGYETRLQRYFQTSD